jgi:hypothetical protein
MLLAVWSKKTPIEDQDNILFGEVIAQFECLPVEIFKLKVRSSCV